MPPSPAAVVAAFARRIAIAGFVQGAATACFVVAVAFVATTIGCRLLGGDVVLHPAMALSGVPVLAAGLWQARRVRLSPAIAAGHLDRRLQLHGLLLAVHEGAAVPASWQQALEPRLLAWRTALPTCRWQPVLWRPELAVAMAALLLLWPAPPSPARREPVAFAGALQALQQRLQTAFASGWMPEAAMAEWAGKLAELAAGAVPDDPAAWRELDALAQQIAREQLLANLDPGRAAGDPAGEAGRTAAVVRAVEAMRTFVQDDRLPAMARSLLERALAEVGDCDPLALGANLERLQELAARFASSGLGERLAQLGLSAVDQERLRGLASTLRDLAGAKGGASASGDAGSGPGQPPGVEAPHRGAEVAAPSVPSTVRFHEATPGGAPRELALPEGQPVPREWLPIGSSSIEPTVSPIASTAVGGASPGGTGGATWQLQVAPRHRAIVQRFFAAGFAATTKERR